MKNQSQLSKLDTKIKKIGIFGNYRQWKKLDNTNNTRMSEQIIRFKNTVKLLTDFTNLGRDTMFIGDININYNAMYKD